MVAPYRDLSDSLRARAEALERENAALRTKLRRLEASSMRGARYAIVRWLTGALAAALFLGLALTLLGACFEVIGAMSMTLQ